MAVEEHGRGRQYLRFRVWPGVRRLWLVVLVASLAATAVLDGAPQAGGLLGATALALALAALRECGAAQAEIVAALRAMEGRLAVAPEPEEVAPERVPASAELVPVALEPARQLGAPRG
jgi:hypothetical protein